MRVMLLLLLDAVLGAMWKSGYNCNLKWWYNAHQATSWAHRFPLKVMHRKITCSSLFLNTHTQMANHSPIKVSIYIYIYIKTGSWCLNTYLFHPRCKLTWNVLYPKPHDVYNVEQTSLAKHIRDARPHVQELTWDVLPRMECSHSPFPFKAAWTWT